MPKEDEKRITREVETDFKRMEEAMSLSSPGIADLLKAYDEWDAAAQWANEYIRLSGPRPIYSASDNSGGYSPFTPEV